MKMFCLLKKQPNLIKHITVTLYVIVFTVFSVGCQTSTKSQCYEVDWYEIARSQGAQGKKLSPPENMVDGCPLTKNPSLIDMYKNGYNAGLTSYCQVENAFEMGRSGQEFKKGSCPLEMQDKFLQALIRGQRALRLEKSSQTLRQQIDAAIFSLKDINLSEKEKSNLKLNLSKLKNKNQKVQKELTQVIKSI